MTDGARPPPPSIHRGSGGPGKIPLPSTGERSHEGTRSNPRHRIGRIDRISVHGERPNPCEGAALEALSSEDGIDPGSSRHLFTEEGRLHEIFSFYYARLVVCATGDERTVSRWAQAEATRAERLLVEDPANLPSIASTYLSNPIQSDVGPSPRAWDGRWRIPLADFIETSPSITGARWRLANAELERGMVILHEEPRYSSDAKLCRLLRERIRASIIEDAASRTASVTDHLRARLADALDMIESLNAQRSRTSLDLAEVDAESMAALHADDHRRPRFWSECQSCRSCLPRLHGEHDRGAAGSGDRFLRGCAGFQSRHHDLPDPAHLRSSVHSFGMREAQGERMLPRRPREDALCDQDWMDHPLKYIRAAARRMKSANDEATSSRGDGD